MKKLLLMLVAVVLVSSSCQRQAAGPNGKNAKAPTRVRIEKVSTAMSKGSQTYVGMVEEREATAVSFTSMGVIRWMLVHEGQAVSKGQPLAKMDSEQARNVLIGATAQMMQANDALERYKMLHEAGSLPDVKWVEIQSKVEQAKAQLEIAQKNLADCKLLAPVDGVIGKIFVKAGETAMPSQAVVSILDISSVKVKVAIPEAEISSIDANTSSTIKVEAVNGSFAGGQIEKGVQADALTHTYDIRINVANGERKLLPGMVASVQFVAVSQQQTQQLSLPVTAVQKKADGSLFVWTVGSDSTAHRTVVTTGETTGNRIVIATGLKEGDCVVTEGYQKLSEGTKVVFD